MDDYSDLKRQYKSVYDYFDTIDYEKRRYLIRLRERERRAQGRIGMQKADDIHEQLMEGLNDKILENDYKKAPEYITKGHVVIFNHKVEHEAYKNTIKEVATILCQNESDPQKSSDNLYEQIELKMEEYYKEKLHNSTHYNEIRAEQEKEIISQTPFSQYDQSFYNINIPDDAKGTLREKTLKQRLQRKKNTAINFCTEMAIRKEVSEDFLSMIGNNWIQASGLEKVEVEERLQKMLDTNKQKLIDSDEYKNKINVLISSKLNIIKTNECENKNSGKALGM